MNKVNLVIHILSDVPDISTLIGYDTVTCGKCISNENEIKVNKVPDGYTVLCMENMLSKVSITKLVKSIVKLFFDNIKDTIIDIFMIYNCKTNTDNLIIHENTAYKVLEFSVKLAQYVSVYPSVNYTVTDNIKALVEYIQELEERANDTEDEYIEPMDEDDDPFKAFETLDKAMKSYNRKHKKKKRKHYNMSRVIKSSRSPKKVYNRHGIIVCKNKKAIKHDAETIKEFLKDFIPGNSEWKKEFRKELCKRWIQMYMLTPKQLKHIQKNYRRRKHGKKKTSYIDTGRTLEFTRRLLGVPDDIWSDPNK